jgi:hypothetical protein
VVVVETGKRGAGPRSEALRLPHANRTRYEGLHLISAHSIDVISSCVARSTTTFYLTIGDLSRP